MKRSVFRRRAGPCARVKQKEESRPSNAPSPDLGSPSPPFDTRRLIELRPHKSRRRITATRFALTRPCVYPASAFPLRAGLHSRIVSVTIAHGGVGNKLARDRGSALHVFRAAAVGKPVEGPLKVLEFPILRIRRMSCSGRYQAAAMRYGMGTENIGVGFMSTLARSGPCDCSPIRSRQNNDREARRGSADFRTAIQGNRCSDRRSIRVVTWRFRERLTTRMDLVVKQWCTIAEEANCAVHLVHHTRKLAPSLR